MSGAVELAPVLPYQRPPCPHRPPCSDFGRDAKPVDRHSEFGWSLLCNGGILFDDGAFLRPRPRDEARPIRVVLHVWGLTVADAQHAAKEAYSSERTRRWQIEDLAMTTGVPCPIRRDDPLLVGHHAVEGRVWAAYPVTVTRLEA